MTEAQLYAMLAREAREEREQQMRVHGGERQTVTMTSVTVYERVRGFPKTQRRVSAYIVDENTETTYFEVEEK